MKRTEQYRAAVQLPILSDCRTCPEFGHALANPNAYGMSSREEVARFALNQCEGRPSSTAAEDAPAYANYDEYIEQLCEPARQLEVLNAAHTLVRLSLDVPYDEALARVAY